MFAAPWLRQLTRLGLFYAPWPAAPLPAGLALPALRELAVGAAVAGPVAALATWHVPALRALIVAAVPLQLLAAPWLGGLTRLEVSGHRFGAAALAALLARTPRLRALRFGELTGQEPCSVQDALCAAPLPGLEELHYTQHSVTAGCLTRNPGLGAAPWFAGLRSLALDLAADGLGALCDMPLPNLRELALATASARDATPDALAAALARAPWLPQLARIKVTGLAGDVDELDSFEELAAGPAGPLGSVRARGGEVEASWFLPLLSPLAAGDGETAVALTP